MASDIPLLEKDQISVGKPLPFSVFSADGQLLLAAGRSVDSERARQMLVKNGVYRSPFADEISARKKYERHEPHKASPLTLIYKDYGTSALGRRFALTMAPNETHEAYNAWVIGATDQSLIVTAPLRSDGTLVAVTPGQVWLCRTFQVTSAFRFRAAVLKAAFEPFPHLHLEVPKQVEKRKVRGQPRASVFVPAQLHVPTPVQCVLLDLSVSGGRIAVENSVRMERGHALQLLLKLDMVDFHFDLTLRAHVVGAFGSSDSRHPGISFYGIQFEALSELETIVLHGFVNQHLAVEMNSFWQVLSTADQPAA